MGSSYDLLLVSCNGCHDGQNKQINLIKGLKRPIESRASDGHT